MGHTWSRDDARPEVSENLRPSVCLQSGLVAREMSRVGCTSRFITTSRNGKRICELTFRPDCLQAAPDPHVYLSARTQEMLTPWLSPAPTFREQKGGLSFEELPGERCSTAAQAVDNDIRDGSKNDSPARFSRESLVTRTQSSAAHRDPPSAPKTPNTPTSPRTPGSHLVGADSTRDSGTGTENGSVSNRARKCRERAW